MTGQRHRGALLRTALVLVLSMLALNAGAQGGFGGGGGGGFGGGGGGFGGGGGGRGGFGGGGGGFGGGGGGFGGARMSQPTTWSQFSLDAKDLDLTRQQKRTLRDICDQYDDDVKEVVGRRNTQMTPEMQSKVAEFREATNKAIDEVLTEEQRTIRMDAINEKAAARAAFGRGGGRGGFGGGGGGFGGGGGGGGQGGPR